MTSQSFLSKLGFGRADEPAPAPAPVAPRPDPVHEGSQFDRMGRLGEKVGEQMAYLASRLNEMQSLRDDFASIVQPISNFVRTHEEAQTRVLELEALLGREREDLRALRRELADEGSQAAKVRGDLAAALKQLSALEDAASTADERIRTLQSAHDEARSQAAYVAQQLANQSDRNESLTQLVDSHAAGLAAAEQKLAAEQARASDLADAKETIAAELARLQDLVEELSPNLLTARRRVADLEAQVNEAALVIGSLESRLATERDQRAALEQSRAQEAAAWDNERSTLIRQLDGLGTRHSTTNKLLEQARQFGRDKSEELLRADKLHKDAIEIKVAAERRLALAQDEARQAKAEAAAAEARLRDLAARTDMLERAMFAKDAQTEQANSSAASLADQIAAMTARFEQDKALLENANRKLIEQLQNEKAERALAQGALSIARSSREKLLEQVATFKRQKGLFNSEFVPQGMADEREHLEGMDSSERDSNVRMLKPTER